MSVTEDRRNPKVPRVSLTTLVDICAQTPSEGPFQGESRNVSGRGMHVRTSYLPPIGEQLVCRFEHDDHEILVEGRVAWRSEGEDSGEFGIQFTALDADSADVLSELGQRGSGSPAESSQHATEEHTEEVDGFDAGQRVRLHIDGLGAPMKAAVHDGNARKIRVGSNLEFLKVGRALEVESVEGESKRGATVDSVNVVVNPATGVPELVVQLRYEGVSPTPPPTEASSDEPAGIDFDDETFGPVPEGSSDHSEDDEPDARTDEVRAYIDTAMSAGGEAARRASALLGRAFEGARKTASKRRASKKVSQKPVGRFGGDKTRRVQSASRRRAPSYLRSGIHDMGLTGKKQRGPAKKTARKMTERKPGRWILMGSILVVLAGSAYGLRSFGADNQGSDQEAKTAAAAPEKKAREKTAAPNEPPAQKPSEPAPPETPDGIVADVPLFGPKAMATAEPVQKKKQDDVDDAAAEKRAAAAAVDDESWDDDKAEPAASVKPWGRGKLHLPTIHRIRLDEPGTDLSGVVEPSGFTIVVPGRKAMEAGRAIEKRDKRIVQVKASNTAQGARVRFEFRGPVPPYRVRLRKDFVEFLISAPQDGVAKL